MHLTKQGRNSRASEWPWSDKCFDEVRLGTLFSILLKAFKDSTGQEEDVGIDIVHFVSFCRRTPEVTSWILYCGQVPEVELATAAFTDSDAIRLLEREGEVCRTILLLQRNTKTCQVAALSENMGFPCEGLIWHRHPAANFGRLRCVHIEDYSFFAVLPPVLHVSLNVWLPETKLSSHGVCCPRVVAAGFSQERVKPKCLTAATDADAGQLLVLEQEETGSSTDVLPQVRSKHFWRLDQSANGESVPSIALPMYPHGTVCLISMALDFPIDNTLVLQRMNVRVQMVSFVLGKGRERYLIYQCTIISPP